MQLLLRLQNVHHNKNYIVDNNFNSSNFEKVEERSGIILIGLFDMIYYAQINNQRTWKQIIFQAGRPSEETQGSIEIQELEDGSHGKGEGK